MMCRVGAGGWCDVAGGGRQSGVWRRSACWVCVVMWRVSEFMPDICQSDMKVLRGHREPTSPFTAILISLIYSV
jgi:hypothetical protein